MRALYFDCLLYRVLRVLSAEQLLFSGLLSNSAEN